MWTHHVPDIDSICSHIESNQANYSVSHENIRKHFEKFRENKIKDPLNMIIEVEIACEHQNSQDLQIINRISSLKVKKLRDNFIQIQKSQFEDIGTIYSH